MEMSFRQESLYLHELAGLCSEIELHERRFNKARETWLESTIEAAKPSPPDEGPQTNLALLESVSAQRELWLAIDGFTAIWARASLLLHPTRRSAAERGEYLRSVLGIGDESEWSDRELRNHWMHYDERLDAAIEIHGDQIFNQRFSTVRGETGRFVLREVVVPERLVVIGNEHVFDLGALFESARRLKSLVEAAQESQSDRHRSELLDDPTDATAP